jgi:hypothetical protein
MWPRIDVKEESAKSNKQYSRIIEREKVSVLALYSFLSLGINHGHMAWLVWGERSIYFRSFEGFALGV